MNGSPAIETSPKRLAYLSLLAAGLGLAAGGASWVLLRLIALLTNVALLHEIGWELPSLAEFHPGWWLIPTAMLGGLIVSLLAKWAPVIRGHGLPEAMEAVLTRRSRVSPRAAVAKPAAQSHRRAPPCRSTNAAERQQATNSESLRARSYHHTSQP